MNKGLPPRSWRPFAQKCEQRTQYDTLDILTMSSEESHPTVGAEVVLRYGRRNRFPNVAVDKPTRAL
jgi:hypothetical protein